jgi:hypothetical protein
MSKKLKIPQTASQAVAHLLKEKKGLSRTCNRIVTAPLGTESLCGKPAVHWHMFKYPANSGYLSSAESLCRDHKYQIHSSFEVIVFNSWAEIQVFQVMNT